MTPKELAVWCVVLLPLALMIVAMLCSSIVNDTMKKHEERWHPESIPMTRRKNAAATIKEARARR